MSCSEIERDILAAAHRLTDGGSHEFTAFMIARAIKAQKNARLLVPYSKVLNALESLQDRGMLKSRWADAAAPEDHSPRRLYHLTEAKP